MSFFNTQFLFHTPLGITCLVLAVLVTALIGTGIYKTCCAGKHQDQDDKDSNPATLQNGASGASPDAENSLTLNGVIDLTQDPTEGIGQEHPEHLTQPAPHTPPRSPLGPATPPTTPRGARGPSNDISATPKKSSVTAKSSASLKSPATRRRAFMAVAAFGVVSALAKFCGGNSTSSP